MLIRTRPQIPSSAITDRRLYLRRRDLLRDGALTLAGASGAAALLGACSPGRDARASSASKDGGEGDGGSGGPPIELGEVKPAPPRFRVDEDVTDESDATSYNNFYELGLGKDDPKENAHLLDTDPWSVVIEGEVGRPGRVPLEDLLRPHALEERIYRLRCVEAWSMVIPWIGIPLRDVLARFEPTSKARYVAFQTILDRDSLPGQRRDVLDWPYREGLRIDEAMHPLAILAVGMYGEVLPNQNGAPVRLVVPWKYGFKSIKSIVRIRLQSDEPYTSWSAAAPSEYGFYANVNPEVDHPRWSQARERRIGEWTKRPTLPFNGYADEVAGLYAGMDLRRHF